jgi:hypothetical protein
MVSIKYFLFFLLDLGSVWYDGKKVRGKKITEIDE